MNSKLEELFTVIQSTEASPPMAAFNGGYAPTTFHSDFRSALRFPSLFSDPKRLVCNNSHLGVGTIPLDSQMGVDCDATTAQSLPGLTSVPPFVSASSFLTRMPSQDVTMASKPVNSQMTSYSAPQISMPSLSTPNASSAPSDAVSPNMSTYHQTTQYSPTIPDSADLPLREPPQLTSGANNGPTALLSALMELLPDDTEDEDSSSGTTSSGPHFMCEVCGHEASNLINLTVHQKNHKHGLSGYKCEEPKCRFAGDTFENLLVHRKRYHRIAALNRTATSSVASENEFILSKTTNSSTEEPDKATRKHFRCNSPGCDSKFQSYSGLKYHQLLHSGTKDHKCTEPGCTAAFTNSSGLKIHKMTHDPASKAWKCNWDGCRAAFTTSSALSTHIRTHTGAKPYHCTWTNCEKNFARADHLKIHLRSHTNERPYICQECGKGFTNSSGLRTHEKTHRR